MKECWDVRHSLPIVDLRAVLILLRPLNDCSAEHDVTGNVQRMRSSSLMFGNRKLAWGRVNEREVGRDSAPWFFSCAHFRYHMWISLLWLVGQDWANQVVLVASDSDFVMRTDATNSSPVIAVCWCLLNRLAISVRMWSSSGMVMVHR